MKLSRQEVRSAKNDIDRRDFLRRAAGLLASASIIDACGTLSNLPPAAASVSAGAPGTRSLKRIGLQLYTVRHLMAADSPGTLADVAGTGYSEVEFAGFYGHSAREMRRWLDDHALSSPAGHVSIEDIRAKWPQIVDDAHSLGWTWIICPWINQADRTGNGYRRVADEFNRAGEAAERAGLRFGYHNHEFDFRPMPDGTIPYDLLLSRLDPRLVDLELDLYWIAKGGSDPLKYFSRFPGRFPLLHVKDMTAGGEMADVGDGAIDFKTILGASLPAGARHFLVEHDEPRSPIADIRRSIDYLKTLRF